MPAGARRCATPSGQRWLFWGSLIPAAIGPFMGLAGTFQWPILPRFLTHLVSSSGLPNRLCQLPGG